MHNDGKRAAEAMRAGASVFSERVGGRGDHRHQPGPAGRVYLTPAVTKAVMERMGDPESPSAPALTARQRDVLRLIVKGQRMKEIAAALNLSARTIETHKYEMMDVLGVHSTAELVRYAIEQRLIDE